MSEYWVSKKKYWVIFFKTCHSYEPADPNHPFQCQYCEIYIADDVPSRSQHENGLRHKGNKDRFIRGLYKAGVKKKNDSEEEKREMKRVELAAQAAYARDVGAGLVSGSSSSMAGTPAPAPSPKPRVPPPKLSDPYTNYTTAASLGISDPDVDRLIEEANVRKSEGRAGDWVSVVPPPPPSLSQARDASVTSASEGVKLEREEGVGEVRKRVAEEPEDEDDTRRFKMRKKTVAVGLGEIYDPGVIRVKPRVQPCAEAESPVVSVTTSKQPVASRPVLGEDILQGNVRSGIRDTLPGATEKPSWTRREWKRAGAEDSVAQEKNSSTTDPKLEDAPADEEQKIDVPPAQSGNEVGKEDAYAQAGDTSLLETDEKPKEEPTEPVLSSVASSSGSLFRKRKVPVGSNRGRRKG